MSLGIAMTTIQSPVEVLASFARGEIEHVNAGLCPDGIEGPLTRDNECPVCQALVALESAKAESARVTVSLSAGKAKALGLLSLQPGVHAICEGDLAERFAHMIDAGCVGARAPKTARLWVRCSPEGEPMLGTVRLDQPTYERWEDHSWVMLSDQAQMIPDALRRIARQVVEQNNRGTDQPIFAVLQKREMVTLETHEHDRIVWVATDSGDYQEASVQKARHLEKKHSAGDETPGWERYAVKEVDEFVTACFSEQGCKDYLSANGHNLRQPFIYAFGSHRNAEWRHILQFLKSIHEACV